MKSITMLSFTQQTADVASKIYADLKNSGRQISSCDVLIGATAIEKNLPVVAEDKHFNHISDVIREKWNTN